MITKILLTLLVIIAGYLYLKRRNNQTRQPAGNDNSLQRDLPFRMIAIVFLLVSFLVTCGVFTYHWLDGRQLLQVTLVAPDKSELVYRVYKKDLDERSFVTTDGQIIRISAQERLQIRKSEE